QRYGDLRCLHSLPTRRSSDLINDLPDLTLVQNKELKVLLEITELRFHHALQVRRALRYKKKAVERKEHLKLAKEHRLNALEKMKDRKSTRLNSSHVKISYAVF